MKMFDAFASAFTNIDAVLTHPARDNDESLEAKVHNKRIRLMPK